MPNIDLKDHPQIFRDRPQQIWVMGQYGDMGAVVAAYTSEEACQEAIDRSADPGYFEAPTEVTLHRPSLQPIYGGPTLLEALWAEMDAIMARLMTDPDEGDKYRAQELAWVIAIVTNAYNPDINQVRAEAVRRWNAEIEGADQ